MMLSSAFSAARTAALALTLLRVAAAHPFERIEGDGCATETAKISMDIACGETNAVLDCVQYYGSESTLLQQCLEEAGCTAKEARTEIIWVVERCSRPAPEAREGALELRQIFARETSTTESTSTETSTASTTATSSDSTATSATITSTSSSASVTTTSSSVSASSTVSSTVSSTSSAATSTSTSSASTKGMTGISYFVAVLMALFAAGCIGGICFSCCSERSARKKAARAAEAKEALLAAR